MQTKSLYKIIAVGVLLTMFGCLQKPGEEAATSAPAQPQQLIRGQEIAYELNGVKLTGYIAYDERQEGKRPGIIVVHQWWGHSSYVRMRAEMLARLGYTAFALDMFGDGKYSEHPEDAQRFVTEIVNHMDVAEARFEEAKRILKEHPTVDSTRIAAIGYCFGGGVVLHMARIDPELDGVASFHGGLESGATAKEGVTKAAILVLNGEDDPWTTPEQIAAFEQEMADAHVDLTFINYPGAKHAFTDPAATERGKAYDLPLEYNEQADKQSWAELQKFLTRIFAEADSTQDEAEGGTDVTVPDPTASMS